MVTVIDPFNEGHWAREDDVNRYANPYPRGCHHFNEWERGWERADQMIKEQDRPEPKLPEQSQRRPRPD